MSMLLIILLASFAETIVSLVGGIFAIFYGEKLEKMAHFAVSFAVGALLSVSLLELIPEAIEMSSVGNVMLYVLIGIILFFVLEKFLFWYHCHDGKCEVHTYTYLILYGDFIHNFIDGVIIALAFLVDKNLGILTTVAVIFHEIPQEIGDFIVLMHGGLSRSRAILYNFLISLSVIPGALITYAFGATLAPFLPVALGLVAGNFIYIASTDLMPELHEQSDFTHTLFQIAFIIIGALLVIAPKFFFG